MQYNIKLIILTLLTAGILFSCKKDEETIAAPSISDFELGYDNSQISYLGADLHMEANVVAEGKINTIRVTIHPEGEEHKSTAEEGWEIDTTYSSFYGLKNTNFHEHLDIPTTADTGHYHFHFIVIDLEGNSTEMEKELLIMKPADTEAPVITITSHPEEYQTFSSGQTITISGSITDNLALGGLYVGLVRVDQNLSNADVSSANTITLLHTHEFDSQTQHSFTAQIVVGAAQDNNTTPKDLTGNLDGGAAWQSAQYYLLVKSPDAFGGGTAFSEHYLINLNL